MSNEINESLLRKIEKLLALGQSPNENEADAAMKMAHALLLRHNLTMEDVEKKEGVQEAIVIAKHNIMDWEKILANGVTVGNYCSMLLFEVVSENRVVGNRIHFLGRQGNVRTAKMMFEYLHEVIMRHSKTATNKAEYKYGMAIGLAERIKDIRFEQELETIVNEQDAGHQEKALITLKIGDVITAENQDFINKRYGNPEKQNIEAPEKRSNDFYRGLKDSQDVGLNKQIN